MEFYIGLLGIVLLASVVVGVVQTFRLDNWISGLWGFFATAIFGAAIVGGIYLIGEFLL